MCVYMCIYIYIYICIIYIYIYVYIYRERERERYSVYRSSEKGKTNVHARTPTLRMRARARLPMAARAGELVADKWGQHEWGRCKSNSWISTDWGKRYALVPLGNIKGGQREDPKSPPVENRKICSDPTSAEPICPFPKDA